jgi:hypothetical protein
MPFGMTFATVRRRASAHAPHPDWRGAVRRAATTEGVPLAAPRVADFSRVPVHTDFSRVRLHADQASAEAARLLSARAFTIGSHIFFGRGESGSGGSYGVGESRPGGSYGVGEFRPGGSYGVGESRPGGSYGVGEFRPGGSYGVGESRPRGSFGVGESWPGGSFGRGGAPSGGDELLRHELIHVAQSPDVDLRHADSLPVSDPADAAEREAAGAGPPGRHGPGIRRVLAAYSSPRTEILPSFGDGAAGSVTSVTSTADAARLSTALAPLVTAGKIVTQTRGDLTYFAPPATGAATLAEVTAALQTAKFPRAVEMASLLLNPHNAWAFSGERVFQVSSLWTFEAGREKDALHQVDRPLTAAEQAEAALVFGPGLNYSAINIREDPVLGALDIARTLPGSINFPPGASTSAGYLPWLIHELAHSWQYQHGISLAKTAWYAILCQTPLASYDYGGEAGLTAATAAGKGLRSFNTEQQGDIARNYYRAVKAGRPTTAYAPFVSEFQTP